MNREELMPHRALLVKLYIESDVSVDRLPYSSEFEDVFRMFLERSKLSIVTRYDLYQELVSLRKAGLLPTKRRKEKEHSSTGYRHQYD